MGVTFAPTIVPSDEVHRARAREALAGIVFAEGRHARIMLRPLHSPAWSVHTIGERGEPVEPRYHLSWRDALEDYDRRERGETT